ncbi:hypothetical protein VTN77DRAFT_153 [Rasamsonia byssochlamydoides]|uniref:uncharacterized protein n=1 Tax=Rasamsonia byssochlamydoides TaxID=89139 RepID=UPI0037432B2C
MDSLLMCQGLRIVVHNCTKWFPFILTKSWVWVFKNVVSCRLALQPDDFERCRFISFVFPFLYFHNDFLSCPFLNHSEMFGVRMFSFVCFHLSHAPPFSFPYGFCFVVVVVSLIPLSCVLFYEDTPFVRSFALFDVMYLLMNDCPEYEKCYANQFSFFL